MDGLDLRAEATELAAFSSLHENCPPEAGRRLGLIARNVADAFVSVAEHDPSILLNRTLGLGTRDAPDAATIDKIASIYREHGIGRFFTETGEAVEGDPQHSYGNIERHGFEPAALRENWTFAA